MGSTSGKKMPKTIDSPDQILLWSIDELIPVIVIFGLGIIMHQLTIAVILIFASLKFYRRFRDGRPAGYFAHLMYWYGLAGAETLTIRNPFIRRFLP